MATAQVVVNVLLLVSLPLSFVPQMHRTMARRSAAGISIFYLLVQFMWALEQLWYCLSLFTVEPNLGGLSVAENQLHDSLESESSMTNKFQLAHAAVNFIFCSANFALHIYVPGGNNVARGPSVTIGAGAIAIVALPYCMLPILDTFKGLLASIIIMVHVLIQLAIVVGLFASYLTQYEASKSSSENSEALSMPTLVSQAVLYLLLSANFCVTPGESDGEWWQIWGFFYFFMMSMVVNNAVFAGVQGTLAWRMFREQIAATAGVE